MGESILVPFSGVLALLPGPNIFFYFLAFVILAQFFALRGINRLLKMRWAFTPSPSVLAWEEAAEAGKVKDYEALLESMEKEYGLKNLKKILYR
jgi:hypothetical protein